jgi:hypothetical protein
VPDLGAVHDRPELGSVADDRIHRSAQELDRSLVAAVVEGPQTLSGADQDARHRLDALTDLASRAKVGRC